MAPIGRNVFVLIAVVFHLVYIKSIFDIYFVSPIVSGMKQHHIPNEPAPAKRLVLFVGDGLRADKAFQSFPDPSPINPNDPDSLIPRPLMPFLRSKIYNEGTFGVSHTRVPTESRPGHVALIAGLYEDVSSVTTGWKLNPVNFDSVFNQSRHTWSWGSPDILPMFKEGATPGKIHADTYGAEEEDFTGDSYNLDIWVFDKVKEMFEKAKTDAILNAALREDKLVFFLHLLGIDSTGHGFRPYSKEYLHNIKIVDQGVKEIVELMEDFYNDDKKTAYVFTADHGMSDWGSHGDGHPDNTRTPLIVWGSGVAKPVISKSKAQGHEDGFSFDWGFDKIQRNDVAQADIAALMSYLIGVPFPVNSVGELPLQYVGASVQTKAKALFTNAKEILEMYLVKEEQKSSTAIKFKHFQPFMDESIASRLEFIETLIEKEDSQKAIDRSNDLIQTTLQGLRYLQTYDWFFLRTLVTAGYIGWMLFGIVSIIDVHVLQGKINCERSTSSNVFFSSLLVAIFSYLYIQNSPIMYYVYSIFPIYFWEEIFVKKASILKAQEILLKNINTFQSKSILLFQTIIFGLLLQGLVWSYTNRIIYTICYISSSTWPLFYGKKFLTSNIFIAGVWVISSLSMSIFTVLPAMKIEDLNLILLGGFLMISIGMMYLIFEDKIVGLSKKTHNTSRNIIGLQIGLIILSMITTYSSVTSLQSKQGLPLGSQIVGWIVLISSLLVPILHTFDPIQHYIHRMLIIFLTFAPAFVILTISYEGLFYVAFSIMTMTWVELEHLIFQQNSSTIITEGKKEEREVSSQPLTKYRPLTLDDIRPSLFTLYLLQSAYFSTGNIASVSSFSLDAVARLIPVFDPFSQGALLVFKILIPFITLSACLGILNKRLGFAPGALFMGLIVSGDWLTINFFYMVRDEGSWLEIGETISRFCIVSALCVFAAGIEAGSSYLVGDVIDDSITKNTNQKK